MRHVIALCRLSTEEQNAEGRAGLLRQREAVMLVAQRFSLEVVETIELIDVSGAQVRQNSEYQRTLKRLQDCDIDGLVIPSMDRLMRPDDFSSFAVLDVFMNYGKLLWTPQGPIDV